MAVIRAAEVGAPDGCGEGDSSVGLGLGVARRPDGTTEGAGVELAQAAMRRAHSNIAGWNLGTGVSIEW